MISSMFLAVFRKWCRK